MAQLYGIRSKADWRALLEESFEEGSRIKRSTRYGYASQLMSFCELTSQPNSKLNPYLVLPDYPTDEAENEIRKIGKVPIKSLLDMKLEEVEDLAEEHTKRFDGARAVNIVKRLPEWKFGLPTANPDGTLDIGGFVWFKITKPEAYIVAPKRLNQQISALKLWLHINWRVVQERLGKAEALKNRRNFRQLHFDKVSRTTSGLREERLNVKMVRNVFSMANGEDGMVWGWYALMGVRPSLIPEVRVKHLERKQYTLENGVFKWADGQMPPMVIVPNKDDKGRHLTGNKADFEYPAFIPTVIAQRIEIWINNAYDEVTPDTPLSPVHKKADVDYVMRKYFRKVGFKGRPYMARKFASGTILKQLELGENGDELLKETMLNHKKGMDQIYDILSGIDDERLREWRKLYQDTTDKFIHENIFNVQTSTDLKIAEASAEFATALGADERLVKDVLKKFQDADLDLSTFQKTMHRLVKGAQDKMLAARIDEHISKKYPLGLTAPVQEEGHQGFDAKDFEKEGTQ